MNGLYLYSHIVNISYSVRPVLSLKHVTQVFGETGTVSDPYIVGTPITQYLIDKNM